MEKNINLKWRLENLLCWDNEIHETFLSSTNCFQLYPRGLNGKGDNFVVKVFDSLESSRVELLFIGADGSVLCKQEVQDPEWEDHYLTLPPGPKVEDYGRTVTNVDALTLRLHLSDCGFMKRGCTTIEVLERCLKIPAGFFEDMDTSDSKTAFTLYFRRGDLIYECDLIVHLVGLTKDDSEISIEVTPIQRAENVLFYARVSLLDGHDVVIKAKECKHIFRNNKSWMLPATFEFKEVNGKEFYLQLRIKLIFKDVTKKEIRIPRHLAELSPIKPSSLSEKGRNLTTSDSLSMAVLSEELLWLYQDQDFSDFSLKCDNVTIPVHKAILSARSPVFKRMLSCDMQEAATGCVDIADMEPSTLARFLAFLYTGRVQDLQSDVALNLYYSADKYQVPSLKKVCGDFLGTNVSVSNVCEILSLADHHQDDQLRSVAHDFILKNYNAVLCSEEWKSFMLKEPLLGVKTLTLFVEQNRIRIAGLKKVCGDFFRINVSISNVCEILSLADRHQDNQLKSVDHEFLLDNFNAVLCSEEWNSFILKESLLVVKTLTLFGKKNKMKKVRNS